MSCASSSSLKRTEIQKKRNIKSRKIDKRKRKMLMSKAFHNKQNHQIWSAQPCSSSSLDTQRFNVPSHYRCDSSY